MTISDSSNKFTRPETQIVILYDSIVLFFAADCLGTWIGQDRKVQLEDLLRALEKEFNISRRVAADTLIEAYKGLDKILRRSLSSAIETNPCAVYRWLLARAEIKEIEEECARQTSTSSVKSLFDRFKAWAGTTWSQLRPEFLRRENKQ